MNVCAFNEAVLELEFVQEIIPEIVFGKYSSVSKDAKAILGASKGNIQATWVVQETNTRCFVTTDTTEQNKVFFSALETVYRSNFKFPVKTCV